MARQYHCNVRLPPIADIELRSQYLPMAAEMTFRDYLERRQVGDAEVSEFLTLSDPAILERRSWADLMWAFRAAEFDANYIATARGLHQEYSRALGSMWTRNLSG
jgi:hypothetical protein